MKKYAFLGLVAVLTFGGMDLAYRAGTILGPVTAEAQVASVISGAPTGFAYDHEALSVTSGAAVSFTKAKVNPTNLPSAKSVEITVETQNVRYRYDGKGDPTTSTGHQVLAGGERYVIGINNINQFRMIAETGTATVRVTYLH